MRTWPRRVAEAVLLAVAVAAGAPAGAAAPAAASVETGLRLGAAFDLGDGRWATAAHVVCGLSAGADLRLDGRPARLLGRAEGMDLAVIAAPSRAPAALGPAPRAGETVAAVGATWTGLRRSESKASGRAQRLAAYGEGFVVRLDAAAAPGFSGGPVLGADGRTVGMLVALRAAGGAKEGFVLSTDAVRAAAGRAHLQPLPC